MLMGKPCLSLNCTIVCHKENVCFTLQNTFYTSAMQQGKAYFVTREHPCLHFVTDTISTALHKLVGISRMKIYLSVGLLSNHGNNFIAIFSPVLSIDYKLSLSLSPLSFSPPSLYHYLCCNFSLKWNFPQLYFINSYRIKKKRNQRVLKIDEIEKSAKK